MNERTMLILETLCSSNQFLSLLDQIDNDIQFILKKGWAEIRLTIPNEIRITDEGRKALFRERRLMHE